VIVRPPAIYGPRDTEMLELFRAAARVGVVPVPAGRASLLHVDDLARLLLALVPAGVASGQVLAPDDGRDGGWAHGEMARAIGVAVGRRVRVITVPGWALRLGARVDRLVRGGGAKLTPDRAAYMAHPDWVVDPGLRPDPGLWRAEIATAAWYRAAGWL
jgi:nucleoside-diphosphate-sugar epimerase